MKIILDKEETIGIEYTTLNHGKIVIDISEKQIGNIINSILEHSGAEKIVSNLDYNALLDFKIEIDSLIKNIQEYDMAIKQRF